LLSFKAKQDFEEEVRKKTNVYKVLKRFVVKTLKSCLASKLSKILYLELASDKQPQKNLKKRLQYKV
jgi:hypothetical protein